MKALAATRGYGGWLTLAACLVIAFVVVAALPHDLGVSINPFLIAVVGAVGLNVLTGTAGQVSLGQAGFLAVGAYTAVIIGAKSGASTPVTLVVSCLTGAAIGILTGIPTSRLRGLAAVLGTLAMSFIIIYAVGRYEKDVYHGAGATVPFAELFGWKVDSQVEWFWLLFGFCAVAVALHRRLLRTYVGRAWVAIRDTEATAPMLGINVRRYKLLAYAVSGAIVAFAGALDAYYLGAVSAESFTLNLSIVYLAMIVVGGMGSPMGAVAGAAFFMIAPIYITRWLGHVGGTFSEPANVSYWQLAIQGVILVALLWLLPNGIAPALSRLRVKRRPRTAVDRAEEAGPEAPPAPAASPRPGDPALPARPSLPTLADPALVGEGEALLAVSDLGVRYGRAGHVLHGVTLQVRRGEVLSVLGPNGAGKTTLLRALTGFTPAEPGVVTNGSVRLDGKDLRRLSPYQRAREGVVMVAAREKVFNEMTVRENLVLIAPSGRADACVEEATEVFPPLAPRLDRPAGLLSGGERQMLAIARAMALEPRLLLVDETTLGLAPAIAQEVMHSVRNLSLSRGTSVLFVEQNATLALEVADRYFVLSRGQIVEGGVAEAEQVERLHGAYFGIEEE
jgi:ABC-type branched-subunit amino acid transport system ATPase component/ABC-type branched-subunit amino acid transport system permease subunit